MHIAFHLLTINYKYEYLQCIRVHPVGWLRAIEEAIETVIEADDSWTKIGSSILIVGPPLTQPDTI